jgi:hypothetical protein
MGEAKERSAELKDVEPETFVRFLEYAYRGDYSAPSWIQEELLGVDNQPYLPTDAPEPSIWGKKNTKKSKDVPLQEPYDTTTLRYRFRTRKYIRDVIPSTNTSNTNSTTDRNYTPVFLAHVRLYTFADMRLIYPLKALVLHKLQQTLLGFPLCDQRVSDIVNLARYAYDHNSDRTTEGVVNDLRELVVEYMASQTDTIGKHNEFKVLLEEGGEFVTDFWGVVYKCLLKGAKPVSW